MGGKFVFELKNPLSFNKDSYIKALKEVRSFPAPKEVYVSYGSEEMGIGLLVKVQHRAEWTLVLPLNPVKDPLECGLTYGVVSRAVIWKYIKQVLCHICKLVPYAFEFSYEDDDLGDCQEYGYWDHKSQEFVVKHKGLPSSSMASRPVAAH
eukprot:jgi/Chrzof1/9036/Cz03g33230.t1